MDVNIKTPLLEVETEETKRDSPDTEEGVDIDQIIVRVMENLLTRINFAIKRTTNYRRHCKPRKPRKPSEPDGV